MEDDSDFLTVNELTEKLKEQVGSVNNKKIEYKNESCSLKKENLEKFILDKAGELVVEGLDTVRELKSIFVGNPNAEEIESLAQAFKAVSSALSVLKDLQVTNTKAESNKEIKEMEIKARKELSENKKDNDDNRLLLTREEVIKRLIDKSEVIEAEFSQVND